MTNLWDDITKEKDLFKKLAIQIGWKTEDSYLFYNGGKIPLQNIKPYFLDIMWALVCSICKESQVNTEHKDLFEVEIIAKINDSEALIGIGKHKNLVNAQKNAMMRIFELYLEKTNGSKSDKETD